MSLARRLRPAAAALLAGAGFAGSLLAASPASAGEILCVKGESANFREGPGQDHPILFAADRFYPVEVLETKDGWSKIKDFEGDVAWVAARLLAKQETVVVEEDRVNVRDDAGTSSEVVFKAERGEVFKVEKRDGRWLKVVDASGDGGWIRDDMVWGDRAAPAPSPKGKTKGEIEDDEAVEKRPKKEKKKRGHAGAAPKATTSGAASGAGEAQDAGAQARDEGAEKVDPQAAEPAKAEVESKNADAEPHAQGGDAEKGDAVKGDAEKGDDERGSADAGPETKPEPEKAETTSDPADAGPEGDVESADEADAG
jgi:SH3-like domain-containing protein